MLCDHQDSDGDGDGGGGGCGGGGGNDGGSGHTGLWCDTSLVGAFIGEKRKKDPNNVKQPLWKFQMTQMISNRKNMKYCCASWLELLKLEEINS